MGFFDPDDPQVSPEAVFDHFHDVTAWYIEDGEVTIDRELVGRIMIDFGDPRSRHWPLMKREAACSPAGAAPEGPHPGCSALEATANWHRIAREWLFGDPASTELGAAEGPSTCARRHS